MSDRRRRRRAESAEETEEIPTRRRRYNTRSSARNEENSRRPANHANLNWNTNNPAREPNSGVSVVGFPYVGFRRFFRGYTGDGRDSQSSSRRQDHERSTASQRPTGSRSQGSSSRSGEASTSSASTSVAQRSSTARRTIPRGSSRSGLPSRSRSARSSESRRDEESILGPMNGRMRSYAAMSTGGRSVPRSGTDGRRRREVRTGRITGSRLLLRFPAPRSLRPALDGVARARPTTSSGSRAHGPLQQRQHTRFTSTDRGRNRTDEEFSAVMRSLDLVRTTREIQRRRAILRIVDFTDARRRADMGPHDPPRPSRGSNILRSSASTSAPENATSSSRRRHSSSGRENSTIEDIIGLPTSRPAPNRPTANVRVRESTRSVDDGFSYNMTHNGSGFNIRVAFGRNEDEDSESNDPTFSLSGDSDATTFVSSISDADMSTDDVFFSDTDRVESDSGESIESASTAASPHSLVSLSLNALHPSPTPSISSAETDGHEEEEEPADDDDDNESPTLERAIITSMRNVGNPIIFLHNNISVQLLSSMAELADAFSNIRNRLRTNPLATGNASGQGEGGFTPPRYNMEPARRQVPESIDCQRAKLIDELNSNTAECVICTDLILVEERVWPCKNCFNIFHLHCIRRWAKTNRNTEMGGAWICPVCRRPKFCAPNRLRYKCLCGRLQQPKPTPGVTPHCCGKKCRRKCGLLCHPGPCKMSEEETAAVSKAMSSGQGPNDDPPTGSEQAARAVSV